MGDDLVETPPGRGGKSARSNPTAAALCDSLRGKLLVYGTVLPWHCDRGPTGTARNWTEHHRVIPEQGEEWSDLVNRYRDASLCVAGDFNTTLDASGGGYYGTKEGRRLLLDGLSRARIACVTQTERVPKGKLAVPPIDHICIPAAWSEGARVVDAWPGTIGGVRLSDHSGLVVEVRA